MADVERAPSAAEHPEDSKDATLPLTPVSDSDGFKHGDHEDHLDAPNGTPVPAESANDVESLDKPASTPTMDKPVEAKPVEVKPTTSGSPLKPKAAVSVDARTRKTSLQVGKPDPKAPAASVRKVRTIHMFECSNIHLRIGMSRGMDLSHTSPNHRPRSQSQQAMPLLVLS